MRLHGMGDHCAGLDMTIGCLGSLAAMELAHGWLTVRGGGHAAIVMAERWSHTVNLADATTAAMWAWADGGAAMVVGVGSHRPSIADFIGAEFTSQSGNNGHVLVPYGGTREPVPPEGADPFARRVSQRDPRQVKVDYLHGYQSAYAALRQRLGVEGSRLICNQITVATVQMIAAGLGIPPNRVVVTGHGTGHLGASDAVLGLQYVRERNEIDVPIIVGASTAYAFGTGMLIPREQPGTPSGAC
jgi:3-oxoacyl-[acyl-carrier-protein] synthase III